MCVYIYLKLIKKIIYIFSDYKVVANMTHLADSTIVECCHPVAAKF